MEEGRYPILSDNLSAVSHSISMAGIETKQGGGTRCILDTEYGVITVAEQEGTKLIQIAVG